METPGADPLCLDLVNTWSGRPNPASERLREYRELVDWALRNGSLDPDEAERLRAAAASRPAAAARALEEARTLRESLYRALAARAAGDAPAAADLEALNRALGRALPRLRVTPGGPCCGWSWDLSASDLDRPLWPAVRSAAELLTAGCATRLHECEAQGCTWLFVDRSRGGRRRWCDMSSCGNREKARRHYHRTKAARDEGDG
jgi:predicted RNA-binding Zn ribbon-like protein